MAIQLCLNVLEQADGSARLSMNGDDIIVAVNGPAPVRPKQELTDRATLQVSIEALNTPPSIKETAMAFELEKLLSKLVLAQLHPRSLISIVVQPISLGPYPYASIVNTCMAALIDAGIPMRSTVVAVSGVIQNEKLLMNPTSVETKDNIHPFMFVFDGHQEDNVPVSYEIYQPLAMDRMNELASAAKAASNEILNCLRSAVSQRLNHKQ